VSQTFDDSGLTHTGFTDEHRVVLGAAREDLHHALDFLLAADNRVKLALAGSLREVTAELVEDLRALSATGGFFLSPGGDRLLTLVTREQLDNLLAYAVEVGAELHEHLSGNAFTLTDEAQQDVLGTDVVVAQLQCFAQ